jgi:hypothetical protein
MLTSYVALVSELPEATLPFAAVTQVAAAIDKQVTRDFGPLWTVNATVAAFARLEDVPLGYWKVMVRDSVGISGVVGIHRTSLGEPVALVEYSTNWAQRASHEVLETLADPSLNRLVPVTSQTAGVRVQMLVEVCDPCQTKTYSVNGVDLCDFVTPNYFDPVGSGSVRYSFTGAVTEPQGILSGGYLTFFNPADGKWYFDGDFGQGRALYYAPAPQGAARSGLRVEIDRAQRRHTARTRSGGTLRRVNPARLQDAGSANSLDSRAARADSLRREIESWTRS